MRRMSALSDMDTQSDPLALSLLPAPQSGAPERGWLVGLYEAPGGVWGPASSIKRLLVYFTRKCSVWVKQFMVTSSEHLDKEPSIKNVRREGGVSVQEDHFE
jgi:hypothetical protein